MSLKPRKKDHIWFRGAWLLTAERLWLNTQRLTAIFLGREVISNVWWPVKFKNPDDAKIISLWLNSTPGILLYVGHRLETQGPWVCFKKATLKSMPVLNPNGLSPRQKEILLDAYEELSREPLLPFPQIAQDPTRKRIDKALEEALELPALSIIREFLSGEPIISLRPLY
ncbi:MAG: hypothetical protein ACP5QG_03125 [candidate division WOR-3 bacterium]